ncbi:hypothetical protein ACR9E3_05840 [Actinomycetospora sp. C-140]
MARHRAAPARAATPPPAPAVPDHGAPTGTASRTAVAERPGGAGGDLGALLPRQGGLTEAHPSGPLPRSRRAATRPAPGGADAGPRASETSPLDLAAIALAAASTRQGGLPAPGTSPAGTAVPRTAADEPPGGPTTGGTPRPAYPAAVPSALAPPTPSHPLPAAGRGGRVDPRRRVPLPTRTAGALALLGALAGGGVAVIGGGTMLASDRTPVTGELPAPELAAGSAAAAATVGGQHDQPQARHDQQQSGRHRADGTRGDAGSTSSEAGSSGSSGGTADAGGY